MTTKSRKNVSQQFFCLQHHCRWLSC
jgi:hypothetical protein